MVKCMTDKKVCKLKHAELIVNTAVIKVGCRDAAEDYKTAEA